MTAESRHPATIERDARSPRIGRPLVATVMIAVACTFGAALAGWLLGLAVANVRGSADDWRYAVGGLAFVTAVFLIVRFWPQVRRDAAWGFLIVGAASGLLILLYTSPQPNSTWDGQVHFDAANSMSYQKNAQYDNGDLYALEAVPYEAIETEDGLHWYDMSLESMTRRAELLDELQGEGPVKVVEGTERSNGGTWRGVNAVGRTPLAFGLWFGRWLGFGNLGEYQTARLMNLAFYLVVCFFGIRFVRSSQLPFTVIALSPVALFQAVNFTYDPWINSLVLFAYCRFTGEVERARERLDLIGGLLILVPFTFGCFAKAVYAPLALGFLGLPGTKFRSWRGRLLWWLSVVAALGYLLSTFMLPFLRSSGSGYTDERGGKSVNAGEQLQFIIRNPLTFFRVMTRTGVDFYDPEYLAQSAWELHFMPPTELAEPIGWTYLCILTYTSLIVRDGREPTAFHWFEKVVDIAGLVGAFGMLATSLYLGFSPVASLEVAGLQARYLLPMYPAIFGVLLAFPWLVRVFPEGFRRGARVSVWVLIFLYLVLFILFRYAVFFD